MNPDQNQPQNYMVAALLAWLVPGLGHLYLGRKFKGIMFTVLINGLFLSGWVMSHGEAMSLHKEDGHRYAFIAEVGAGGPTLLSLAYTHAPEIGSGFDKDKALDYAAERETRSRTPEYYTRLPWYETGLLYCMVAGLLNFLVVYEASTGGLGVPKSDEEIAAIEAKSSGQSDTSTEKDAIPSGAENPPKDSPTNTDAKPETK
ncbi:MAG: hypothetical protein P1V97_25720 [Planctomycetota bacterium]|nr:hypothetical protein [Planctomycetota bacterium]